MTEWVTQGFVKEAGNWGEDRKCDMTADNGQDSEKGSLELSRKGGSPIVLGL